MHGADTSTPLLSESEQAADRRERRHRRGGAYRALRQFDFKYLQPLLLATPMKRLPREERPGRKGESGSGARKGGGVRERRKQRAGFAGATRGKRFEPRRVARRLARRGFLTGESPPQKFG